MRLFVYYAIQIAFVIAGFTGVSIAFVTINSAAMSNVANQLVSEAAVVAVTQVWEPLEKFSLQVKVFADALTSMPSLRANDPTLPQWNETPAVAFDSHYLPPLKVILDPAMRLKMAMLAHNPLAMYAYESFEMPDNSSQWADCVVARGDQGPRSYWTFRPSFRRNPVDPLYVLCHVNATDPGNGQLTPALIDPGYQCDHASGTATGNPWQIEAKAMTVADGATGRWTSFYMFVPPDGSAPVPLLTFGVPTQFSKSPDPDLGRIYTTSAAQMDLNALFLADALLTAKSSLETIDLALFWDRDDTIIAWTLPAAPINPVDQSVLQAGATGSKFDDAIQLFAQAGWCNRTRAAVSLSMCTPPLDTASTVRDSANLFALRRVTHINAKFSIIISGSRRAFFGPGEEARAVGIGVSVATCLLAVGACCGLWLAISSPLSRLIEKMQSAARFEDVAGQEPHSCASVTEIVEADNAFRDMHAQLLSAKPFMPRHLLIALGTDSESHRSDEIDGALSSASRTHGNKSKRSGDSMSRKQSTSQSSHLSEIAAPLNAVSLQNNNVAVLVCNLNNFATLCNACPATDLQGRYADLIDVIVSSVTAHRGVVDTVQGDHVIVTFNSAMRCPNPSSRAVHAAFEIRECLSKRTSLPEEWRDVTFGVASSKALCGPMGSTTFKSHATLGSAMRTAVSLQRYARAWSAPAAVTSIDGAAAPYWCIATSVVAAECATFAHFHHVAVAKVPSSQTVLVISALCPPISMASSFTTPPSENVEAANGEWLYEVHALAAANPWARHNSAFTARLGIANGRAIPAAIQSQLVVDTASCQQVLAVGGVTLLSVPVST